MRIIIACTMIFLTAVAAEVSLCQNLNNFGHQGRTHKIPIDDYQNGDIIHWRHELSCGVASTYMLLHLLGIDVNYDDVLLKVPITAHGSNMSDMKNACEYFGLRTKVFQTSPRHLAKIEKPAIVHLETLDTTSLNSNSELYSQGHFVVLLEIGDNTVTFLNPSSPEILQVTPIGDFVSSWSGHVMNSETQSHSKLPSIPLILVLVADSSLIAYWYVYILHSAKRTDENDPKLSHM